MMKLNFGKPSFDDAFRYAPLSMDAREIRLLRVDVLPGDDGKGCRGSLVHQALPFQSPTPTPTPSYAALSYCWGCNATKIAINLDGREVQVPQSAVLALARMVRQTSELIWIDGICIDQQHATEKSWQVAMMKDIYKLAREVRIWLGDMDSLLR